MSFSYKNILAYSLFTLVIFILASFRLMAQEPPPPPVPNDQVISQGSLQSHPDDVRYDSRFTVPGLDGEVLATTVYEGDVILGGSFQWHSGAQQVNSIARWDGTDMHPLGDGFDGRVEALIVYDGDLIAAGNFTDRQETGLNNIARWDGEMWQPLGDGFTTGVEALTLHDGELVAAGWFIGSGQTQMSRVARWDGEEWQPMGEGLDRQVYALLDFDGDLIAGGFFTLSGETVVDRIARWDGESWQPMGEGFGATVFSLIQYDGEVIAGGDFTNSGETEVVRVARWDGENWNPMGEGFTGRVRDFAVFNGDLIAGGTFLRSGETEVNRIARWDGSKWQEVYATLHNVDFTSPVNTLYTHDDALIVGGFFQDYQEGIVNFLQYESNTLSPVYSLDMAWGLSDKAWTIIPYQGDIVVGGEFIYAGKEKVNSIARWDGENWHPMGDGLSAWVVDLTVFNGDLIAVGSFTHSGETQVNRIARWDGENWHRVGQGFNINWPTSLTEYDGDLIVAGAFTHSGATQLDGVARWDGQTWHPMGDGFSFPAMVYDFVEHDAQLIAGGGMSGTIENPIRGLAGWDGQNWQPYGGWSEGTTRAWGTIYAMSEHNGDLIAAGNFSFGDPIVNSIARWDGENWYPKGSGLHGLVEDFIIDGEDIYLVGDFHTAGSKPATRFTIWGDMPTAAEDPVVQYPGSFTLDQNYPNPFNPGTQIRFRIPESSHVTLTVYDMLGRQVAVIVDELRVAGYHTVAFDATDLASGLYIYRLDAGSHAETRKMMLVR